MRMRLLVADDDPGIAEPLRRRLEEEGYSVDVAHDAASVLWAATENTYDVIVLDVNIPRADDVLSRTELLVNVWDEYYSGWSNVVDVYVRYLRNKIDRPFGVTSIETVPREGYRLRSS